MRIVFTLFICVGAMLMAGATAVWRFIEPSTIQEPVLLLLVAEIGFGFGAVLIVLSVGFSSLHRALRMRH